MFSVERLKESIIIHMKTIGFVNSQKSISKANLVLSITRELNIEESQKCLIKEAFEDLVQEDMIRSSYNKYNAEGKLIGTNITAEEEKFYLK